MAYALFAQKKILLDGELNNIQLQQTQRSDEQYELATQTLNLQQQLTSMNASQSGELAELYAELSETTDSSDRDSINAEIKAKESSYEQEVDSINRDIYQVSVKENAIEMEVKRLDTQVTTIQKQLDAVEQAESSGIDRATPKFSGMG
jgi:phenylalanyl-tRNA synthetase alpha subunit